MLYINATIEEFSQGVFVGYTREFKGLVAQGSSVDQVKSELSKLIRVKIAYQLDFPIEKIKEIDSNQAKFIQDTSSEQDYRVEIV